MKRKLLFAVFPLLIAFSCKPAKTEPKPNKDIFGTWYSKDNPKTFIEIDANRYREVIGEIDSELIGVIYWNDSLNFEIKITKVEGAIGRVGDIKPGKTYSFNILYISSDSLQMNANKMVLTFSKNL